MLYVFLLYLIDTHTYPYGWISNPFALDGKNDKDVGYKKPVTYNFIPVQEVGKDYTFNSKHFFLLYCSLYENVFFFLVQVKYTYNGNNH